MLMKMEKEELTPIIGYSMSIFWGCSVSLLLPGLSSYIVVLPLLIAAYEKVQNQRCEWTHVSEHTWSCEELPGTESWSDALPRKYQWGPFQHVTLVKHPWSLWWTQNQILYEGHRGRLHPQVCSWGLKSKNTLQMWESQAGSPKITTVRDITGSFVLGRQMCPWVGRIIQRPQPALEVLGPFPRGFGMAVLTRKGNKC